MVLERSSHLLSLILLLSASISLGEISRLAYGPASYGSFLKQLQQPHTSHGLDRSVAVGPKKLGAGLRPVIFMHGVWDHASEPQFPMDYIPQQVPGIKIYPIRMYNGYWSVVGLRRQLSKILPHLQQIMNNHTDTGVTLLCYSQGGVICRSAAQMLSEHNIHTMITLSSPVTGQYGITKFLEWLLPYKDRRYLWKFFYTSEGQDFSVGSYWNDPHHQDLFTDPHINVLLAELNNQTGHNRSREYKENFIKLSKLVMIGGPDDQVITPWQSSIFGYYNESEAVISMEQQEWYQKDSFGLRTLNKAEKIKQHIIPGVHHINWYRTKSVFDCCIIPYLR